MFVAAARRDPSLAPEGQNVCSAAIVRNGYRPNFGNKIEYEPLDGRDLMFGANGNFFVSN
jgi:hypothetical protein